MDDFIMVSPPVDSLKAGQRKGGTGSLPDAVCSNKSLTDGHHQSGKPTRLDEFSKRDTAGTISDDFDAVNSSGASSDSSKARKNAKKNAKRRARKKAKRKNKRSSDTGSTGLETLSEECAVGSSTSESSINNDIDHRDETVSSPDRLITANDSGGESNGITNRSETSETSTSETSDMDVSKGLNDEHGKTIHSFDMSSNGFSDIPDSLPFGSVSVGCINEEVKILKCYNVEANLASNSEDTNRSEVKFFPENRQSAGSKASARMNIQENEFSVFPELGNVRKGSSGSVSQSGSRNNFPEPESQTNGDESVTFELDRIESRDSMNTTNLHEQQSAVHLRPLIGEEVAEPDKGASPSENGEQEHSSASVMRKWKPVLGKDSGFANNSVEENPSPDYQKQISSNEFEIMRVDHRSGNANRSSPEDKSSVQRTCTRKQLNDLHPAGNRSTDARKEKHVYAFRADLRKNSVEENPSSNSENQISSNEFEIMRVDQRSGNANRSSSDDKSPVQYACSPKQVNCSTDARKEKHIYAFRADLRKNSVEENPSSNSQNQISSNEFEIMRGDRRSGNANRSSPDDKSPVQNACTPKQVNCSSDARKEKHVYAFRADLRKNSVEENPSSDSQKQISSNGFEIMCVDRRSGNANRSSPEDKHIYAFRADSRKNSVEENPSSNSLNQISSNESEIMRVDHRSGNANRSSPEDKSPVQNACTPKQLNCSTDARKEKHIYAFRADSSKNSVEENPSEISLNESEIMRVDHRSGNANRSSPEDKSPVQNACTPKQLNCSTDHRSGNANRSSPEDKSPVQNACTPKQLNRSTDARKEKHVYSFRADSSEISGALHDSYRVQQLSESVHLATGNPIAEFEKLLHAASPIICRSNVVNICRSCSQDDVGRPLCPHEVPNIALKSLWKWYEKRSSYGLGVRLADNDRSMRSGFRRSTVQAYFVPYLSAVQLFKKPENRRMNIGHVDSRTCEVNKTSERSSNVGHLPIFKVLVPRPGNQMYSSQGSSMSESVDTATTDDLEILFEYFESDPPQLRKPLFEK